MDGWVGGWWAGGEPSPQIAAQSRQHSLPRHVISNECRMACPQHPAQGSLPATGGCSRQGRPVAATRPSRTLTLCPRPHPPLVDSLILASMTSRCSRHLGSMSEMRMCSAIWSVGISSPVMGDTTNLGAGCEVGCGGLGDECMGGWVWCGLLLGKVGAGRGAGRGAGSHAGLAAQQGAGSASSLPHAAAAHSAAAKHTHASAPKHTPHQQPRGHPPPTPPPSGPIPNPPISCPPSLQESSLGGLRCALARVHTLVVLHHPDLRLLIALQGGWG